MDWAGVPVWILPTLSKIPQGLSQHTSRSPQLKWNFESMLDAALWKDLFYFFSSPIVKFPGTCRVSHPKAIIFYVFFKSSIAVDLDLLISKLLLIAWQDPYLPQW